MHAIEALQEVLKEEVFLPGSNTYDELSWSYFSELERELRPACFVTPNSTAQVACIVKALRPFANDIKIAICGAGQQSTAAVANVRDGITIHLRGLKGIKVDEEKSIVSIAAGEQMGRVYDETTALGLAVAGNRHPTAGIGGDALQGGLSYFSYRRGFICDQVVNYEIVLANGEIVNANAQTNQDLWVALKGAGSNFGIVTRFDLEVFEQGQMWGGKLFYFPPSFPEQIRSLVNYLNDSGADKDVHICISIGYAAALGSKLCMNDIFCTRPETSKSLGPFANVQPQIDQMNTLRVDKFKNFVDEQIGNIDLKRVAKTSTTVKADMNILNFAVEMYHKSFEQVKEVAGLTFSMTFEPIPASMIAQSRARGGNSFGLEPSDGPLVVILLYNSWASASDDSRIYEVNRTTLDAIDNEAQRSGLGSSYRYLNYASESQDPIGSYGINSNVHLRSVREKYDPEGFFQIIGGWPFKLQKHWPIIFKCIAPSQSQSRFSPASIGFSS